MQVLYHWTSWLDINLLDIMTERRIGALRHLVERRHLHADPQPRAWLQSLSRT
jgi:hypothetical protein